MELLQWPRSEITTEAETVREKRGNWYVKNIIEVKYTQVLITDWMVESSSFNKK